MVSSFKLLIKLIWWLLIIYLWYIFVADRIGYEDEHNHGDTIRNELKKPWWVQKKISSDLDIVIKIIKDALQSDQWHHTSDTLYSVQHYQALCKKYQDICTLIHFQWDPTFTQQTRYLAMLVYTIYRMDWYLNTETKLVDVLSRITIDVSNMGRRWTAGTYSIVFNMGKIKSHKEFLWVIAHELNHTVDLAVLEGTLSQIDHDYTEFGEAHFSIDDPSIDFYKISRNSEKILKAWAWFRDFVSGYGLTTPFEDFAEAGNLYLYHYELFYKMSKSNPILARKFAYMQKLYNNKTISKGKKYTDSQSDPDRRPRDTTKLSNQ